MVYPESNEDWPSNFPRVMTSQMFFDFADWLYNSYLSFKDKRPCPTRGVMYAINCCFGFGLFGKTLTPQETAMLAEFIGYALQDEGL